MSGPTTNSHLYDAMACAMVDHADSPLAFLDTGFRLLRANRAYAEACRCLASELPGRDHFDCFPHGDDAEAFARVRATLQPASGREVPIELPGQPGQGLTWWDWSLSPAPAEDGTVEGFVLSLRDVTDKVQARMRAEKMAAELRVTLSSIGDAVIVTDGLGRVTFVNRVAETLTGYAASDAIGRALTDTFRIVHENSRNEVADPIAKVLATGAVAGLANHTVLIARDRSEHPIDDSAAPIRDEAGNLIGAVLVFRDISERRRVEEELRLNQQSVLRKLDVIMSPDGDPSNLELADLFDVHAVQSLINEFHKLVPIPMAIIDLKGKVLVGVGWQDICTRFHRVHPETCKHCIESDTVLSAGARPGEARVYKCKNNMWDVATPIMVGGHHLGNVFTGQFFFDDEPVDYAAFRSQACAFGFAEESYMAALGAVPRLSRRTLSVCVAFLAKLAHMVSQSSFHALKLARAVAERSESEEALKAANDSLEEADRRKNEFLAMLAHELRNPLAAISNAYHVMERTPTEDPTQQHVRAVVGRQLRNLSHMVDDLLDVARITHGKLALSRERLDLSSCIQRAVAATRPAIDDFDHELRLALPADPVWVEADGARVEQIIGNLLLNAVKYTDPGGTLQLTLEVRDASAALRLRDNGVGIAPALLPRIFEPFTQAESGIARSKGGLGIGLALVRTLVELHGGTVEAFSDGPGCGAEFLIRLPLAPPPQVARQPSAATAPSPDHGARILVVDDNCDSADTLADLLQISGHEVRAVYCGPDALRLASAWIPDVVLLDIGMPDMDGYEVARRLLALPELSRCRVIALTGYGHDEARANTQAAGFHGHLTKPIAVCDLEQLIAGAAPAEKQPRTAV